MVGRRRLRALTRPSLPRAPADPSRGSSPQEHRRSLQDRRHSRAPKALSVFFLPADPFTFGAAVARVSLTLVSNLRVRPDHEM